MPTDPMTDKLAAAENALAVQQSERIEQLQKQLAGCRTDILKLQAVVKAERLDHISTIGEVQKANEQLADCRTEIERLRFYETTSAAEAIRMLGDCRAALAEACDKAEAYADHPTLDKRVRTRISALRKAGGL